MHTVFRKLVRPVRAALARIEGLFDARLLAPDVPSSGPNIRHPYWREYLYSKCNHPGMRVLEVGSRDVCDSSESRRRYSLAEYVGFDLYDGPNVDVAGDAHRLSKHFPPSNFDLVFSSACFEHFAMPWVVAHEMAKVLKTGGLVFIETHFCFSSHERPWHFFHYTDLALQCLFSKALGFECLESGMSDPIVGRFSRFASRYLRYRDVPRLYCFSQFLGRKTRHVDQIDWSTVDLSEVVGETLYPPMLER